MNECSIRVRVSEKYKISHQAVAIELVTESGGPLPAFTAGAYIDVDLGVGMVRQYSLANDPAETHRYLLGVLKVPNSHGISAALHDAVYPGNSFLISEPKNLFPLDESAEFTHLVGGGIGITPMLSFAHRLHHLGRSFKLHFCARDIERAPFAKQLADLPFHQQITMHLDSEPSSRLDIAQQLKGSQEKTHLYVCGPNGFMDSIVNSAAEQLSVDQIHKESFDPLPAPTQLAGIAATPSTNSPFQVELRRSGKVLNIGADQSLVDVLQQNGIPIPRGCPRAFCGSCAVTVLEGEVEHRDTSLPDHIRNEMGKMLSCVSRAKSERLVLDL